MFFLFLLFTLVAAGIASAVFAFVIFSFAYFFIERTKVKPNRFGPPSPTRTVAGAIGRAVVRLADFRGRANRRDFWSLAMAEASAVLCLLVALVLLFMSNLAVDLSGMQVRIIMAIVALAGLFAAVCSLSMAVRRLHDVNRSGWWLLLLLVFGYFILLYWFLQPSVRSAEEDAQAFT